MVSIYSSVPGAAISVNGKFEGRDSIRVNLKRGKKHQISVSAPGYFSTVQHTGLKFDPVTILGIIVDYGILTIPFDMLTGNAWKIHPDVYVVNPVPMPAQPQPQPQIQAALPVFTGYNN